MWHGIEGEVRVNAGDDAYGTTSSGKPRGNKSLYYKTYWRTHQMSDHLPLWAALKVDFGRDYLERLSGSG